MTGIKVTLCAPYQDHKFYINCLTDSSTLSCRRWESCNSENIREFSNITQIDYDFLTS